MAESFNISGFNIRKGLLALLFVILIAASCLAVVYLGAEKGGLVLVTILGVAVAIFSVINFVIGFYAATALGCFIFFIGRFFGDSFPVGTIIDLLVLVTFFGLLVHKVSRREPFLYKAGHIITYAYLVYTIFLVLQVFNPSMQSVGGWFFVLRKFSQFLMIYFIAINVFTDYKRVKFFFIYWIALAFIAGIYGCYQEWFGFLPFELDWIMSNPARVGLYLLVTGISRRFSTFSDPAAYGIIMAATFVFIMALFLSIKDKKTRYLLFVVNIFILLGAVYSGTRTAYFIIAAALVIYILMTITKRNTLIFACLFALGFVIIMFGPIYGNATINRIRSTFEFSEEASMQVRDENRAHIQPYIYRHPIGGGLATTGVQGLTYNPNHQLAGFPPDSGYMMVALETGWIGLFLQCFLYLLILQSGVHAYYNIRDKRLKVFCLGAILCVFAFIVGQYGQVAIGQVPGNFLFYSCLALFARLKYLDNEQKKSTI